MKKKIFSIFIIVLFIVSAIAALLWYEMIPKHYIGAIPSRDLEDSTWEASMFIGEGAYYPFIDGKFRKDPPISSDADRADENPRSAVSRKSGIGLNGPHTFDGYWQLEGGLN